MFGKIRRWFVSGDARQIPKPSQPAKRTAKKGRREAGNRLVADEATQRKSSVATPMPHPQPVVDENPPWEKSIVIALRDLQWLGAHKKSSIPPGFASFDSTAEQLGDSALDISDRFYLAELKSSRDALSRERIKVVGAYKALKSLLNMTDTNVAAARRAVLISSMRCHHFIYWMDGAPFDGAARRVGALVFSPYLSKVLSDAAKDGSSSQSRAAKALQSHVALGTSACELQQCHEFLNVARLFDGSANVMVRNENKQGDLHRKSHAVGLEGREFQDYIDWLISVLGGEERPLRMVLMSASGKVMRFISRTSELVSILSELESTSTPSSGVKTQLEQVQEWPWKRVRRDSNNVAKPQASAHAGKRQIPRNRPKI